MRVPIAVLATTKSMVFCSPPYWWAVIGAVAVMSILMIPAVLSAAISQGYRSSLPMEIGSLASLKQEAGDQVVLADSDHTGNLMGVVVGSKDATLSLSRSTDVVQVATAGQVPTLVSDIAGKINSGDPITASPISGVGMKATAGGKIIGMARAGVDTTQATKATTVKSRTGRSQAVTIGTIPVDIQVSYYAPPAIKTIVPQYLQNLSNTIAGKEVSLVRIIISTIVLLAAIIVIAVLLYTGVRSSMLSIGRNPLAQSEIYKGLLQVLVTGIGILGLALGTVYIIVTH